MKIIFIMDLLHSLTGGTENQVVKLINNLDRSKYKLHLILLRETEWINANWRHLNCSISIYNLTKLKNPFNLVTFLKIFKYIMNIKPDIVMTFFPLSNILGVIAARLAKASVIISTRRDYGLWIEWEHRFSIYVLRFADRYVSKILVNAYAIKELTSRAERIDPAKIDVIYNGVDIEKPLPNKQQTSLLRSEFGIPPECPVIGIVGGLKPMKRHITFLRAARRVLDKRQDVHFIVVGDGPMRSLLEAEAEKLDIANNCHFAGSQDDVIPFLSLFNIGVNCSANEGLSNAVMEYMAYGVPCIISDAGGNPELIEHNVNGYLFKLDDDDELSRLICLLLDDDQKMKEFVMKSREKIFNHMTMKKMIYHYEQYFDHLLNKK
jgi:L-malate glycosyltransferase